jgi:hypothetical protein
MDNPAFAVNIYRPARLPPPYPPPLAEEGREGAINLRITSM